MGQRRWHIRVSLCLFLALLILSSVVGVAAQPLAQDIDPPSLLPPSSSLGCQASRILPIVANEYWPGSQSNCPYAHCYPPYSFVRDPSQPPPFSSTDGGLTWQRNACANPYNDNVCQGPYEGYGENFGQAFALLGADAKPIGGLVNPRGGVVLDCRYDALINGGSWHELVSNDTWLSPGSCPVLEGEGRAEAEAIIRDGGYSHVPLPSVVMEQPPAYLDSWSYCWAAPPSIGNCFNYPESNRDAPYEVLQFLSGASSGTLAQLMYDNGSYIQGRYAPGQSVVAAAYNGYVLDANRATAVLVGYFRAIIVGYGSSMSVPCSGTPGNWQSYTHCIVGQPNTVYAIADPTGPLVRDPTPYLPDNQAPAAPFGPTPPDGGLSLPLTTTLAWRASDPDGDPLTHVVAFGASNPPPVVTSGVTLTTFDPGPLASNTTYYWAITTTDGCAATAGPVWSFRTDLDSRPGDPPPVPVPVPATTVMPPIAWTHRRTR